MAKPKAEPKPETPAQHGGTRDRAGRPEKATKVLGRKATADKLCQDKVPDLFANLARLADGGLEVVKTEYVGAGTLTRKDVARHPKKPGQDVGDPIVDSKGKTTIVEVLMYPELDPDTPILKKRTVEKLAPCARSNMYLWDRGFGRAPESAPMGDDNQINAQEAVEKAHARKAAYRNPDDPVATGPVACPKPNPSKASPMNSPT